MNQESQLAALLRGNNRSGTGSFLATVKEVKEETIDVVAGDGTEYFDVQLKAAIGLDTESGMIIKPAVESTVLVSSIEGSNRLYVEMFSGIDAITFTKMNEINFSEVKKMVINKGENGGLVKIEKLVELLEDIKTKFNSHVHNVSATTAEAPTIPIGSFTQSDLEDKNITH